MSDTYLTLLPFESTEPVRYNLQDVAKYPKVMNDNTGEVEFNPFESTVYEYLIFYSKIIQIALIW